MPKDAAVSRRDRRGWKVLLGVAVVAPVVAVVALSPALAAGDQGAAVVHEHGAARCGGAA